MAADFQIAAMQRSGDVQVSFTIKPDQLVLGCELVAQFCSDTFTRRLIGRKNQSVLAQIASIPEVADAAFNLLERASEDATCPYLLSVTYSPLSHSIFEDDLGLGTGTQLLRRQLYYFIMKCGNDYCRPI